MALIDLIVSVNIRATQGTPTLPGVTIPALAGYHNHYAELIKTYSSTDDMLTDGFVSTEPLYKMAEALTKQSPRPSLFKVIRCTGQPVQVHRFKVNASPPTGASVGLTLTNASGVAVPIYHTATVGQTAAQVATAIAAIVVSGATLVVDGVDNTQVNITISAAGAIWYPSDVRRGLYTDATPAANADDDLTAAALVDPDFYGVAGAWLSSANIVEIASWTDTNKRLHCYTTRDNDALVLGSGVFKTLKDTSSNRNYGQWNGTPIQYGGLAQMSNRFTVTPGSSPWAFNTLIGVSVDALTPTQVAAGTSLDGAVSNNGNIYVPVGDQGGVLNGILASGMFVDIQHGIDAMSRDLQIAVFGTLKAASDAGSKVPFTRKGLSQLASGVRAVLQRYVTSGFLSDEEGFQFQVSVPDLATISAADKAARILRNLNFTAVAQGAVQTVKINGSISF